MVITQIKGAVGGLNEAMQLIKELYNAKSALTNITEFNRLNGIIAAAYQSTMAAYAEQLDVLAENVDLKKQIADIEAWVSEKERYKLYAAQTGVFVYALKELPQSGEAAHWLCTNCYNQNKKSILQQRVNTTRESYCPICETVVRASFYTSAAN